MLIVGAGISGVDAAYRLKTRCPAQELADPRRRGTAWAAPGTCSAIPACARTATCSRSGSRSGRGASDQAIVEGRRSANMSRTRRASSGFSSASASATRWFAQAGPRATRAGRSKARARRPDRALHLRLPLPLPAAITITTQGHRPAMAGRGGISRADRPPAILARGPRLFAGKRVAVIGSGATAVTLVPALADKAAHVTMVQRSPSYIVARPSRDRIAGWLQRALPPALADALIRWKNILSDHLFLRPRAAEARTRSPAGSSAQIGKAASRRLSGRARLLAALQAVGPTAVPGARRRPVRGDALGQGVDRDRRDRALHARAGCSSRPAKRSRRYRRHRDRAQREAARRDRSHRRRRARRSAPTAHLQGHDAERRAQSRRSRSATPTRPGRCAATSPRAMVCRLLNHMERDGFDVCVPRVRGPVERRPMIEFSSGYVTARRGRDAAARATAHPWRGAAELRAGPRSR